MSFPNIPDVDPVINIDREDAKNLIIASVAFEELGLAHLINAEAEKIQYAVGTLNGGLQPPPEIDDLLDINKSVNTTLKNIIKTQMLLQFKLENIEELPPPQPPVPVFIEAGSAWSVGTDFGTGNAQYTTLVSPETQKMVVLGLGSQYIPVGSVLMNLENNILSVTISTIPPYYMGEVQVYADDTPPVQSNPGGFPYMFIAPTPFDYFTSYTFNIDTTGFVGNTIYIAAHAKIYQKL